MFDLWLLLSTRHQDWEIHVKQHIKGESTEAWEQKSMGRNMSPLLYCDFMWVSVVMRCDREAWQSSVLSTNCRTHEIFDSNIVFILATFLPPSKHSDFVLWTVERFIFTIFQCLWSSWGQVGMQTQCCGVEMEEKQTFNMPAGPLCLWQQRPGLTRRFRCASSCLDVVVFVPRDSLSPSFSANICYSGVVLYNIHRQEGRSRTPQASLTPHQWIFMRIFK